MKDLKSKTNKIHQIAKEQGKDGLLAFAEKNPRLFYKEVAKLIMVTSRNKATFNYES